jgi:TrmH family RNA methyltransferase
MQAGGDLITSAANPLVRLCRSLLSADERREQGMCLVEGIRPVWQAVEQGAAVERLIVAPDLLRSEPARQMVETAHQSRVPISLMSSAIFAKIASRDHPSGLAAIVRIPWQDLANIAPSAGSLFAAVDSGGNPGNLGTIIRTLDSIGGQAIMALGQGTDPYHPTAIKASMGTVFALAVVQDRSIEEVLDWCSRHGVQSIATSPEALTSHWDAPYRLPCLLLFGSEGTGLSPTEIAACDLSVRIPMAGSAGSLNLSVAAGIMLYEIRRQFPGPLLGEGRGRLGP